MSETGIAGTIPAAAIDTVLDVLGGFGLDAVLIGAIAMAVHEYARSTTDVDLAIGVDPRRIEDIAAALRARGLTAEVSHPDPIDPLGGVIRVDGAGVEKIEIVNFLNPPGGGFPDLIEAALRNSIPFEEGARLRVASLHDLVMFKLYAGGSKSMNDVLELLRRNPKADLEALRATARRYRMDRRLDAWLRSLLPDGTDGP